MSWKKFHYEENEQQDQLSSSSHGEIPDEEALDNSSDLILKVTNPSVPKRRDILATEVLGRLNQDAILLIAGKSIRMFSFGFLAVSFYTCLYRDTFFL